MLVAIPKPKHYLTKYQTVYLKLVVNRGVQNKFDAWQIKLQHSSYTYKHYGL